MSGLARFFCLSSSRGAGDDWGHSDHYGGAQYGAAGGMAKVLEILEEDLDHRLGGAHVGFQGLGSVPLRRLYKSGLPPREQQLCKELLSKVAALDQAREAAEEGKAQLAHALKTAEHAHRQAEFSRAKAEALATARGEALMHAQQATREAQREQAQLREMLQQAVQQLGLAVTPTRSLAGTPEGSFLGLEHSQQPSPSPLAAQQQQQQQQQAPAAERPQLGATHLPHAVPAARRQRSVAAAEPRSLPEEEEEAPVSPQLSPEFSGFTVYTNKLHDSVDMEAPTAACSPEPRPARRAAGASADLRQSHVPWRDISSAVDASLSVDAGSSRGGTSSAAAEGRRSMELRHSEARSQQQQQEGPPRAAAQQEPAEETERQRFQRMARLVLPTLDASQLDSLVRIGASLPSPDMLMSPEVLHHLLPRIWDSSANLLESATGVDVMQLLQQVQAAQPLPPAAAAAPQQWEQAEAGRAALSGRQPMACGSGQEVRQQQQPQGGRPRAARAGTWLSPLKVGQRRFEEGEPTPSPQSHVKAVFGNTDDLQFYLPFSAGLAMEPAAAKEEYRTRAKQAATVAPTAPVTLGGSPGRHQHAQLAEREGRSSAAAPAPGSRHSRQPSGAQQQLQRGSREGGMQVQQAGSLQSHQSSADGRESSAGTASRPGSRAASVAGSVGSRETLTAQPAGRKQAFLSRFQPMGSHVGLQPPAGEPGPGPQHHSLDSTSAVAPPAAGGRPAAYHKASVDENAAEGPAGLRRQPSGEAWARYSKAPALGSRSAPASPVRGAAGLPAAPKQPGGTHALADSTNAAEGYLQRLAQQRAQHVYAPSRLY